MTRPMVIREAALVFAALFIGYGFASLAPSPERWFGWFQIGSGVFLCVVVAAAEVLSRPKPAPAAPKATPGAETEAERIGKLLCDRVRGEQDVTITFTPTGRRKLAHAAVRLGTDVEGVPRKAIDPMLERYGK